MRPPVTSTERSLSDRPPGRGGLALLLSWRRVCVTLGFSVLGGLMLSPGWRPGPMSVILRTAELGLLAMLAYGVFEQWPRRLSHWLARWVLQVVAVGLIIPAGAFAIYMVSTSPGAPRFWLDPERLEGFTNLSILGVLLGPWVALGALVRQKEALARHQALEFALARSELERQVLDARLSRLQAQVAPHFLFNTLANVQALVDAGSPQAAAVLRSLVAYLRTAVPRLDEPDTTLGDELRQARAYLELMHMRMPDRLHFTVRVDDEALALRCPPLTLLTLVENAVRHGIDPSEDGGRIDIEIHRVGNRCRIRVSDTGVGMREGDNGPGTGLAGLRQRLELVFGGDSSLRLGSQEPHGTLAELELPAIEVGRR
jgi:signal transduction histidine kinase